MLSNSAVEEVLDVEVENPIGKWVPEVLYALEVLPSLSGKFRFMGLADC
jgi:hypothetical protein